MTLHFAKRRSLYAVWGDEKNAVVARLPGTATKSHQEALVAALTGLSEELRKTFGGDTFLPYGAASPIYRRGRRKYSIDIVRATGEGSGFLEGMVASPPQYHGLCGPAGEIRRVLGELRDPMLAGKVEAEVQRQIDALEAAENYFSRNAASTAGIRPILGSPLMAGGVADLRPANGFDAPHWQCGVRG